MAVMSKRILVHLMNSRNADMFTKIKNFLAPKELIKETLDSREEVLLALMARKLTILSKQHSF